MLWTILIILAIIALVVFIMSRVRGGRASVDQVGHRIPGCIRKNVRRGGEGLH